MKKILGLAAVMVLAMSQVSFSAPTNTDAAVQRLVKVAKQRQAQQAKEAAKGVVEEEVVVPVDETVTTTTVSPELNEAARQRVEEARAQAAARAAQAREEARRQAEEEGAKAAARVDFYERVVRSVQREEKELGEFDSVLGRDGVKNSAKKTRRTAK